MLYVIATRNHFASSLLSILPSKKDDNAFLSMYMLQEEDAKILYQWSMMGIQALSVVQNQKLWHSPTRLCCLFTLYFAFKPQNSSLTLPQRRCLPLRPSPSR